MNRNQLTDWLHCLSGGMYDWVADEIKKELAKQEFYPDWDMIKPFHERIKELEEQLAKPERKWYGLSDKDCDKAWEHAQMSSPYGVTRIEVFAKDIERRLKEKNDAV